MAQSNTKIIFWNCHSMSNKLLELKWYIYTQKPHIVCLQETWTNDGYEPSFINYKGYFKNRAGRGGGLLTLVRNDLVCINSSLTSYPNGKLEIQRTTIKLGNALAVDIANLYNPNQTVMTAEFDFYFNQFGSHAILLGDFNAHSPIWDRKAARSCPTARNLWTSLIGHPLQLVTPQSMPTFMDSRTGITSTIDLCFVSPNLFPKASISLGTDCGSDHCPILLQLDYNPSEVRMKTRPKWKLANADWKAFNRALPDIEFNMDHSLEEANDLFISGIHQAGMEAFGRTSGQINIKYNNVW
jgi:exonuclease III